MTVHHMYKRLHGWAMVACLALVAPLLGHADSAAGSGTAAYAAVTTRILDEYYRANPTAATDLGLHQYDSQLEDYSRAAIDREVVEIGRQIAAL